MLPGPQLVFHHVEAEDADLEFARELGEQRGDFGALELIELGDDVITLLARLHQVDEALQAVTPQAKTVDALGKHAGEK